MISTTIFIIIIWHIEQISSLNSSLSSSWTAENSGFIRLEESALTMAYPRKEGESVSLVQNVLEFSHMFLYSGIILNINHSNPNSAHIALCFKHFVNDSFS